MTPTIRLRLEENRKLTYADCLTTARQLLSAVKKYVEEGVVMSTIDNGY